MPANATQHAVVVIGTGSIGERHTRCFLQTGRARVSICEPVKEVRQRVSDSYNIENTYSDFDRMLASQSPGVAIVCTPADSHVPLAQQLVDRGFHVLIEKPISVSCNGLHDLQESAKRTEAKLAIAYVLRASPLLGCAKQLVESGDLGPLLQVTVNSGQHFPTYRPAYRNTYYRRRATGGGAIQDALTHLVNAVQWVVGPVHRVAADCDRLALEGVEVEDTVHVIARHQHDTGVMVSYSLNQHQAPNETVIHFSCQNGTVRVLLHNQRCEVQTTPDAGWQTILQTRLERDDGFVEQAIRFLDCVEGRRSPDCTLSESAQTLCAIRAILEAAEKRQWVTVRDWANEA